MDLTFHIVFCPGTVRYLRLAVMSLLRHSDYRYRLVGNGLGSGELAQLQAFCQTSDRLEYLPFPTRTVLPHGILLSLLQARETGDYFCFMDSDIFASSRFQEALEEQLADCDVFSSCSFMGVRRTAGESQAGYGGVALTTPNGLPLATSFFAVYRQAALRRVMAETGVGFEDYGREHHTARVAGRLAELGIDAAAAGYFDTGKLLNVVSHAYGVRFRHVELDGLTHIGSITLLFNPGWFVTLRFKPGWFVTLRFNPGGLKERLDSTLKRSYVLRDDLESVGGSGGAQLRLQLQRIELQHRIARFFMFFLRSLVDHAPEPRVAVADPDLASRVVDLREAIRTTYREYSAALTAPPP